MSKKPAEYGIMARNALVKDLHKFQATSPKEPRTILLGQILKIEGVLGGGNYAVRFLKSDGQSWESTTYCADSSEIMTINEKLWQFLNAVTSPQERVRIAQVPNHCEKLLNINKESTVELSLDGKVCLGCVKFIGEVRGLGSGLYYGVVLHERRPSSNCNGNCAGIQYFNCLPGFGHFATIDQFVVTPAPTTNKQPNTVNNVAIQHHINSLLLSGGAGNSSSPETPTSPITSSSSSSASNMFRTSTSLQNISPILNSTGNLTMLSSAGPSTTETDFTSTSTVLRPDRVYPDNALMSNSHPPTSSSKTYKSEIDLIEAIGGTWPGHTDKSETNNPLESYAELKLKSSVPNVTSLSSSSQNGYNNGTSGTLKHNRNRSSSVLSHFINGPASANSRSAARKAMSNSKLDLKPTEDEYSKIFNEHFTATAAPVPVRDIESKSQQQQQHQPAPAQSQQQELKKVVYEAPDLDSIPDDLGIGSLVEVSQDVSDDPLYGVIRWLGQDRASKHLLAGVELEEEMDHLPLTLTNGTHLGQRYFSCGNGRGLFVPLGQCHKDGRFQDNGGIGNGGVEGAAPVITKQAGQPDCPVVQGSVAPLSMPTEEDVEAVCGKFRGIQGHHNSCYLDATLFAMFTYTAVFDSLLYRPKGPADIMHYEEVQRVLREEIVNPLRTHLYVSADKVMNLRKLLDELSSVSGLTSEEKDPEEFLNSLLAQILKAEPFLKLSSGQEAYHYQLFVEKDEDLELPSVQQLFEQSFLSSDIKLKEVPSCLIIQMPRFGKSYKMYPRILPSQLLDVTDIIENSPRQCTVCGKLAHFECKECLGECGVGLESTAFCRSCLETVHSHARRSQHRSRPLLVPNDFTMVADACGMPPPRLYMELFAVVCIETSHYVAFVKCGSGHEAPWCFFDSMADRKGEQNGFNIPEMVACPDVSCWLSHEQMCRQLHDKSPLDRQLPEHARRLLCDAYICMYQSPDVMMYR